MGEHKSDCRDLYEEGRCCSCHLTPPCGFCVSMTEEEVEAYCDAGIDGLVRLWDQRDAAAEGQHTGKIDSPSSPR